ncbi:MAG: DUF6504 family protein [Phycisphaerae bacterium]
MSEAIEPFAGTAEAVALGRGEPGLPAGFTWRGRSYRVLRRRSQWKASAPEGGKAGGEVYLRRHYFELTMEDGAAWTVYFVRQAASSGSKKRRWFLYTVDGPSALSRLE